MSHSSQNYFWFVCNNRRFFAIIIYVLCREHIMRNNLLYQIYFDPLLTFISFLESLYHRDLRNIFDLCLIDEYLMQLPYISKI